jgi:hypothetical protein
VIRAAGKVEEAIEEARVAARIMEEVLEAALMAAIGRGMKGERGHCISSA